MRTAREVIAEAIPFQDEQIRYNVTSRVLSNLRAEGLVIVAAADVEDAMGAATGFLDDHDMEFPDWWQRIATMLDAALAAGDE